MFQRYAAELTTFRSEWIFTDEHPAVQVPYALSSGGMETVQEFRIGLPSLFWVKLLACARQLGKL